jgi:hypothetical protein
MADFLRRFLRLLAVLLAVAPFALAAAWVASQGTTSLVVVAYTGIFLMAAFFMAPALAGALIWWLAGFIREPDDD